MEKYVMIKKTNDKKYIYDKMIMICYDQKTNLINGKICYVEKNIIRKTQHTLI